VIRSVVTNDSQAEDVLQETWVRAYVAAGILVEVKPRLGAPRVGAWLCLIIINLLMVGSYFDVALRDLGLALGAFALWRLADGFAR
jgi:hypothetical protein